MRARLAYVVACVGVLLLAVVAHPALGAGWDEVDRLAGSIVDRLGVLQDRGVNVTVYVDRVNGALREAEAGNYSGAILELQKVSAEVDEALASTRGAPLRLAAERAAEVAALLSLPVLVYLLLPRAYLYLWYLSRREWLVEEARKR